MDQTQSIDGRAAPAAPERGTARILLLDGERARIVELPAQGTWLIGRAADVELSLADAAASRRHAQLVISAGEVTLEDLGSHNGTSVNGERVAGARALVSGDVVEVGAAQLVFHRAAPGARARGMLELGELRLRLAEEIDRARAGFRPLALVALELAGAAPEAVSRALAAHLRGMDLVARDAAQRLILLLPELTLAAARERVARLCAELGAREARAGLAEWPGDGDSADVLLSAARSAARVAGPGAQSSAEAARTELELGGRTVLLADASTQAVFALLRKLARSDLSVLVQGETGSGKEVCAEALHAWSPRASGPLVSLNSAAIPETMVESELFGHEKGAFTGADAAKPGLFERASGGTLFLDELGELSPAAQAKLLRVLETRRLVRLGGSEERAVDVRIVAATHQDLALAVKEGRFRDDLYFRLGAASVSMPPLRERRREIPLLARHFLRAAAAKLGVPVPELSRAALEALLAHPWPGNVRELRNAMDYVAAVVEQPLVEPWDLPPALRSDEPTRPEGEAQRFRPIDEEVRALERRRMLEALDAAGGVQKHAAALISMPLRTFVTKLKAYDLAARPARDPAGDD